MTNKKQLCGYVAIVGRPNVGKSTLLNHLLQQKISITSRKAQTTRYSILGIKTVDNAQMIFVDTPGIHKGQSRAINKAMNRSASASLKDADIIVFVVDKTLWTDEEDWVLQQIVHAKVPTIVVLNKIDQIENKAVLLPFAKNLEEKIPNSNIVPLSALKSKNLDLLEEVIVKNLPAREHIYAEDTVTDRSMRFMAAEIVREKITRQLGAELPHQVAVEIEEFVEAADLITISALVLVEREGQKRILIGEKGDRLKQIGQQARQDMQQMFDSKIMLNLWVKVKSGWSDDNRALKSLGLDE